jgi:hypothetical protein
MLLKTFIAELLGLFIDDGSLALGVGIIVAMAAVVSAVPQGSLFAGAILLFGSLVLLAVNALRGAVRRGFLSARLNHSDDRASHDKTLMPLNES